MTLPREPNICSPWISRRNVVALGAGIVANAAMPAIRPALAQSAPHKLKIGTAEVTVISDGSFSLPMSFALSKVEPKVARAFLSGRGVATDAFDAQINVTVVKTPDALILVDCGGSTDFMPTLGGFAARLESARFQPADVTHVIFTHAHADHLWGLIDPLDDDTRFQKARHIMSVNERDFWLKPGVEETVSEALKGPAIGTVRRLKMIERRIEIVKLGTEILPGVSVIDTAGHTPGHASVLLKFGGDSLLIGGDALSHPIISFEQPDWAWGPDHDAQMAVALRKRLLDQLATERTALLGYHLPWPGVGRVERKDGRFRYVAG